MDVEGNVENSFIIKLANMDQVTRTYELSVKGLEGLELVGTKEVSVSAGEVISLPVRMKISRDNMSAPSADIEVTVKSTDGSGYELTKESRFIGAVQR
ncbi:FixG Ig-like domain-containing protein [Oceanospirillum sp. HFRX-1_2]